MPPELKPDAPRPAPDQWQSIDQWMDTPAFREMMGREFPEDASEWLDPVSRRQFMTLMGASLALAGAAGCNPSMKPASQRKLVPYVRQPEGLLPGVPLFFATAMPQVAGVGLGLLVKSVEGRPIKVEGNPNHPGSLGGTDLFAQASVLSLYDPDRSKTITQRGVPATFENLMKAIREALAAQQPKQGAGVRVVTEPITSPTLAREIGEFLKQYPQAQWVQYEPLDRAAQRTALRAAFGKHVNPVYRLDKADVVLALDSDFLAATGPGEVRYARDFMQRRKVRTHEAGLEHKDGVKAEQMNRLYAVESMVTGTGAVADHRLPVKPSEVEAFARAVAAAVGVAAGPAPQLPPAAQAWVDPLVKDLTAAKGKAVVVVGDAQPPAVHLLALAINEKLGAFGQTLVFTESLDPRPDDPKGVAGLKAVVDDISAGKVEVLFLHGVNPVYDAPADLDVVKALEKLQAKGLSVHVGQAADETAAQCVWHLNAAHYLETWGDVRGYDGSVAIQQPLIAPVYGGKGLLELFAVLCGLDISDPLDQVRATWKAHFNEKVKSGDFEAWWRHAVRDGVVPNTALPGVSVSAVSLDALKDFPPPAKSSGMEIQFRADPTLYDGRYANNGWLQECPKPVTKLTWDNAAIVSPATAEKLGMFGKDWFTGDRGTQFGWTGGENGRSIVPMAELTVGGRKLKAAVFILPGHADDAVTLYVGSGRERAGKVGTGTGFNAYKLRAAGGLWAAGVEVKGTGDTYTLACTQGQYAMEGRRPARTATRDQFKKQPDFAQIPAATPGEYKEIRQLTPGTPEEWERLYGKDGRKYPLAHGHGHDEHGPHDARLVPLSLYVEYPQKVSGEQASKSYRRWGMAIDLGACTGCSACVVACVSENNTPVIGKEQVTKGRAMHWIRIDRYFSIPGADPHDDALGDRYVRGDKRAEAVKRAGDIRTTFQPVMCVHCEKAPCEVVCPVGATVHSADGINDMVYNRCVGTRYCSNNCPYKVRRFNFLQFTDYTTDALKLVNNPEVTVRQRGVMEKCTYCIQRIRNAEIVAEREHATRPKDANGRPKIRDGEVVTACQAACPTGAIVFGDINDADSSVLRWKAEAHGYGLLAELNTMPRTSHIAQVRNPNPAMPAADAKGGA